MNIIIKKEFQDWIIPLTPEEFALLEQSILKHGVRDPLVIWRNGRDYLIDGHHRYQIIQKHNIRHFPTKIQRFDNEQQALNWIIENQLGRRNCTPEAIAYYRGLRYRNEKFQHGGHRKSSGTSYHLKTEQRISELYNVSPRTIRNDEKFSNAVDLIVDIYSSPAKKKQVKNDLLTKQYRLTKKDIIELSTLPSKYVRDVIDKNRSLWQARSDYHIEQKRKDLTNISKKSLSDNFQLYTGDCLTLSNKHLKSESIDCIITDPPYAQMECYEKLGNIAKRVLKPSGFCCCYVGTLYLSQVLEILSTYLEYYWQVILLNTGSSGMNFKSQTLHGRKVDTAYKSILVFQKPPLKKVKSYFRDVLQGGGMEKDLHPWQQAEDELIPLLDTFSTLGNTVLDLFMGSGTTGVVCLKSQRRFIGFDTDRQCVKQAILRTSFRNPMFYSGHVVE
jgi:16S rRNA G966 N2-methylase RsmD